MIHKIQNCIVFLSAIIIGIPLGLIVGLVCWFKFPFQVYAAVRINLADKRIKNAEELIKQYENENSPDGMWDRHIERMKSKQNYDN